jgi:hypothetical protein
LAQEDLCGRKILCGKLLCNVEFWLEGLSKLIEPPSAFERPVALAAKPVASISGMGVNMSTAACLASLLRDEARGRKCAIMRDVFMTCLWPF